MFGKIVCLLAISWPALIFAFPSGDKIVGGTKAYLGQFPYQVSIQKPTANGPTHHCGGSIINENWIVTAAHCCVRQATSNLTIVAGTINSDLTTDNPRIQIRKGLKNEIFFDYDINGYMYDIALIKITEPFVFDDYVKPIAIPPQMQMTDVGTMATVSGWGALAEGEALTNDLMWVEVPTISDKQCEDLYYTAGYDTDPSMICAGNVAEGGVDACQGDSGGPLVANDQLIGIVSWGVGCARPKLPGVYTEVAYYSDWIKQKSAA